MVKEKGKTSLCLCAALVAVVAAYTAVSCLSTGFGFVYLAQQGKLIWWLLVVSVAGAVCFTFRKGWIALACVLTVMLLAAVVDRSVVLQIKLLIYHISATYNMAYGWGVVFEDVLREVSGSGSMIPNFIGSAFAYYNVTAGLIAMGALIAVAVSRVVCKGKGLILALSACALPVGLCCVVSDRQPGSGFLFVLLGVGMLLILTQLVRKKDVMQGKRLLAALMIPVTVYTVLLASQLSQNSFQAQKNEFLALFTQWYDSFFEGGSDFGIQDGVQIGTTIDLSEVGPQKRVTTPVMDVLSSVSQRLYLRGQAFDEYTGEQWKLSKVGEGEDPFWTYAQESNGTVRVASRGMRRYCYVPYNAAEFSQIRGGVLENTQLERMHIYTTYAPGVLGQVSGGAALKEQCLQLPEETLERAKQLLSGLNLGNSRRETAEKIADYVQNSAQYDRNTEAMPSRETDFALWFLEQSDTGYCTHFASAAVVLLRAAGVPARYVTGYMVAVYAEKKATVHQYDSHAWVEYLDEQAGWVVLDPTPAEPEQTEEETVPVLSTIPKEETPTQEQTEPVTLPQETQPEESTPRPTVPQVQKPVENPEEKSFQLPWPVIAVVALVAAVIGQYRLRRYIRKRHYKKATENQKALLLYRQAVRMAALRKEKLPQRLEFLAEKAAFSQHTMLEQELEEFKQWLAEQEERCREKAWYWRLAVKLIWAYE